MQIIFAKMQIKKQVKGENVDALVFFSDICTVLTKLSEKLRNRWLGTSF